MKDFARPLKTCIAQWIDLEPSDQDREVSASIPRHDQRAQAITEGVEVHRDASQLAGFARHALRNMAAIGGRGKRTMRFSNLFPGALKRGDWDLYVAVVEGQTIAALLVFYYGHRLEYFTPAVEESFREMQALPLIIAQAVGDAARCGMTRWNWGATWESQTGVYRFRKSGPPRRSLCLFHFRAGRDLLGQSPAELLERFPNFYVVLLAPWQGGGMSKVVLFGAGSQAEVAHFYLTHDSPHEVVAFTVHQRYLEQQVSMVCPSSH